MRLAPLVPKPTPNTSGKRKVQRAPSVWAVQPATPEHDGARNLEVGDANAPLEREADAIADWVMRMPAPRREAAEPPTTTELDEQRDDELDEDQLVEAPPLTGFAGDGSLPGGPGFVARECSSCEDQDELQRELDHTMIHRACSSCEPEQTTEDDTLHRACASCESEDDELMREPGAGQRGGTTSSNFSLQVRNRIRLGGAPLQPEALDFLEPRLGFDLGRVRVHTDADAGLLARRVNARAFTLGSHIFFAPGQLRTRSHDGLHLLAHEIAHTLQNGPRQLQRAPGDELADVTAESLGYDLGEDLLEQGRKLQDKCESLRWSVQVVINDLVVPDRKNDIPAALVDFGVPDKLYKKTDAAAKRFYKISRELESRDTLPAAMMSQWLDATIEVIALLRECVRHIVKHSDEFTGPYVDAAYTKKLRFLAARAKKLRDHEYFQHGAEVDAGVQSDWGKIREHAKQKVIEDELEAVRTEMRAYWSTRGMDEIRAERQRLSIKAMIEGDRSGVIKAQIEALDYLIEEVTTDKGPSIADQSRAIAAKAGKDTRAAGREVAEVIASRPSSGHNQAVALNVFSWVEFDYGTNTAEKLAQHTLTGFGKVAGPILKILGDHEEGSKLLGWFAPRDRYDLAFAITLLRDGPSTAKAELRTMSEAKVREAVITTVEIAAGQLRSLALDDAGKSLLIQMNFRLWEGGFTHNDRVGRAADALANAVAPVRGHRGKVVSLPTMERIGVRVTPEGDKLRVHMVGRGYKEMVDEIGIDTKTAQKLYLDGLLINADDVVQLETGDPNEAVLIPALKLVEASAKGSRDLLTLFGQELAHRAEQAGDAITSFIEKQALARLKQAEQNLREQVAAANAWIEDNLPESLQGAAKGVVTVFEVVGKAELTLDAAITGVAVGVTNAGVDTVMGGIGLVGKGIEGAASIGENISQGDLIEEFSVSYDRMSHTVGFAMEVAPELVDKYAAALAKKFANMGTVEQAFLIGKGTGMVLFEVGTAALGGAAAKVDKIDDLADFARGLDKAEDLVDGAPKGRGPDLDEAAKGPRLSHHDALEAGVRSELDPAVMAKIQDGLPPGTKVWVDESLPEGTVIVEFDMPNGVVDPNSIRIVAGPNSSPAFILLHGPTIGDLQRFSGWQGRARKLLNDIAERLGLAPSGAHRQALIEAQLEVRKLQRIVDHDLKRLSKVEPGTPEAQRIVDELEEAWSQLDDWRRVADGEITPTEAKGFIAGRGEKRLNKSEQAKAKKLAEKEARDKERAEKQQQEEEAKSQKKNNSGKQSKKNKRPNSDEPSERMPDEWQALLGSESRDVASLIERAFAKAAKHPDARVRNEVDQALTALDALKRHAGKIEMNDRFFSLLQTLDLDNVGNLQGLRGELVAAREVIESGRMAPGTKYHVGARETDLVPGGQSLDGMKEIDGVWQDIDGNTVAVEAKATVGTFANKLGDSSQLKRSAEWAAKQPGKRRIEVRCSDDHGLKHLFRDKPENHNPWTQFLRAMSDKTVQERFTIFIGDLEIDYDTLIRMRERYLQRKSQMGNLHLSDAEFNAQYGTARGLLDDLNMNPRLEATPGD